MLSFNPNAPFPLLDDGSFSYNEAQSHSERVDAWLGLKIDEVERKLIERGCMSRAPNSHRDHQQLWIGLAAQNLLTPYIEIRRVLEHLCPDSAETVVDLGAAYGRMGFVIGRHYPEVHFVGYEFVGERLREAQRCLKRFDYENVKMEHADLSSPKFTPITAEYYFIYDYGKPAAIEKTLFDLHKISQNQMITIIARGKICQKLISTRHQWLVRENFSDFNNRSALYRSRSNFNL